MSSRGEAAEEPPEQSGASGPRAETKTAREHRVLKEISDLCEHYIRGMGFNSFIINLAVRLDPGSFANVAFSNYPHEQVQEFNTMVRQYRGSSGLMRSIRPSSVKELREQCEAPRMKGKSSLLDNEDGIIVPRWQPDGTHAILLATGRDTTLTHELHGEELMADALLFMAQILDSASEVILRTRKLGSDQPLLTERQRQVLVAISVGKRINQIATELGIKPSTVRYLLDRCIANLQVTTREQAVAKATSLGFIPSA